MRHSCSSCTVSEYTSPGFAGFRSTGSQQCKVVMHHEWAERVTAHTLSAGALLAADVLCASSVRR